MFSVLALQHCPLFYSEVKGPAKAKDRMKMILKRSTVPWTLTKKRNQPCMSSCISRYQQHDTFRGRFKEVSSEEDSERSTCSLDLRRGAVKFMGLAASADISSMTPSEAEENPKKAAAKKMPRDQPVPWT